METNLKVIYKKLEEFISRYYLFMILKGSFMLFGLIILIIVVQSLVEYFNYLNTGIKTVLFYLTIGLSIALLIFYFIIPLAALVRIRKPITYKKASELISKHFPSIQDKLLNTLELGEKLKDNNAYHDLLIASINHRIQNLSPLPFKKAINFSQVKRNLVFFSISVLVLLLILAFNTKVFTEGTVRFVNYSKYYEPKAPFSFGVDEKSLICEKNKNFRLELRISGDYIPQNVYLNIGGNSFLMLADKGIGNYFFVFRNVNNSFDFNFLADNYKSKQFTLNVLPSPVLKNFKMSVVPPSYTGIDPFVINNTGDCTVPMGSLISWEMNTLFVDSVNFFFKDDTVSLNTKNNSFSYRKSIRELTNYGIQVKNSYFTNSDRLNYKIEVINDLYPDIDVKQVEDTARVGAFYFLVNIKDDYGFHALNFVRKVLKDESSESFIVEKIQIVPVSRNQDLFYYFDFSNIDSLPDGSLVEYYFEVKDNDFINNYKATRSSAKIFKLLDREEVRDQISDLEKSRNDALSKSKKLTDDIKKEIEDFKRKELNNELSEWEKKNFLKSITDKQKDLDNFLKDVIEKNKKSNQTSDQFYKEQKQLEEKQKQIQELLNQILDEDLKKLLKEIEELSEKFNQNDFEKIKDKIDFSYDKLDKKLDRSLELLKRYQVEDNVMKLSEDMKRISEKEHSLGDNLKEMQKSDELQKKQNEIKEEFNQLKNEYKETLEKNEDLKSPFDINKFDQQFEEISKDLENLEKETPNAPKNKLKKMQENASEKMENLSKQMEQMFNQMEMESIELNIGDLRQIIDNVSAFSFNQEDNFTNTNKSLHTSPSFPSLVNKQVKLADDFKIIEDSIRALMEKVPQMNQYLVKEVESILQNTKNANKFMEARNKREALKFQRYILNSANTLSLYLAELKDQMEKQKQGSGSGKSKKGKQEESMQNLKKQQQKLKQELEKLLEQMKNGTGKPNDEKANDQIVKTLAEQEIFNKMLKELQNQSGINPETDKKLKEIKKLSDQNVEDLINKKITPELLNRNQKILSRMLESEKAEKEREQENKRESKEGIKNEMDIPEELKESLKNENKYRETLQKSDLNLKNYYKIISNDYFRIINQNK
jgi:hypothetical protein